MNRTKIELSKTKLLEKLDEWFETVYAYGDEEDRIAYEQIKRMIQEMSE